MTLCVKTGMASEYKVAKQFAAPDVTVLTGMWTADQLGVKLGKDCSAIISFGLCGGLSPLAMVGDGFICKDLITPNGKMRADDAWAERLIGTTRYRVKDWWSSGQFNTANNYQERTQLYTKTQAWVIDDETYAVAEFAHRRGIPFQALRVVSDATTDNLPPAVVDALNADGTDNIEAVIESVEHNPFQIPALIKTAMEFGKSMAELRLAITHAGAMFGWQ
jgi:adenosylhomocysteine nucleosidase